MKVLTTKEAAERLGVTPRRVRALIAEGKLRATQVGRDYVIEERHLANVKTYGKAGRPFKNSADSDS
jgi:excisionase family DNA binding protein